MDTRTYALFLIGAHARADVRMDERAGVRPNNTWNAGKPQWWAAGSARMRAAGRPEEMLGLWRGQTPTWAHRCMDAWTHGWWTGQRVPPTYGRKGADERNDEDITDGWATGKMGGRAGGQLGGQTYGRAASACATGAHMGRGNNVAPLGHQCVSHWTHWNHRCTRNTPLGAKWGWRWGAICGTRLGRRKSH